MCNKCYITNFCKEVSTFWFCSFGEIAAETEIYSKILTSSFFHGTALKRNGNSVMVFTSSSHSINNTKQYLLLNNNNIDG